MSLARRAAASLTTVTMAGGLLVFDVVGAAPELEVVAPRVQTLALAGELAPTAGGVDELLGSPAASAAPEPSASAAPAGTASAPEPDVAVEPSEPAATDASTGSTEVSEPADDLTLRTGTIETEPFTVMGVTWADGEGAGDVQVRARVREEDGSWSAWSALDVNDAEPQPGTEEADLAFGVRGTEPLVSPAADAVQVEVVGPEPVEDVEAVLIDPGTTAGDGTTSDTAVLSEASAATPRIVTRAQWGADESRRRCEPSFSSSLVAGAVHHTAGSNSYTSSQAASVVRGIYAYHTGSLGWCDIGYNFLVDKFGTVYEGRYGGVTRPVRGAHSGGFNDRTFGIAAIGNYEVASAPSAMTSAIGRVMGWKLALHGASVGATVQLTSAGGGTSRYSAGSRVSLPALFMHRDVGQTACPGANLAARMGDVRAAARTSAAGYVAAVAATRPARDDLLVTAGDRGRGAVEVMSYTAASGFQKQRTLMATGIAPKDTDEWRFFYGSLDGGSRPDLIALQVDDTASGYVEAEVWSWESGYTHKTADVVTPKKVFDPRGGTQVTTWQRADGSTDLVFVRGKRPDTRRVSLHVVSAASGWRAYSLSKLTGMVGPTTAAGAQYLVSGAGDVYELRTRDGRSGRTEVRVYRRVNGWAYSSLTTWTGVGYVNSSQFRFLLRDYDRDGTLDLVGVNLGRSDGVRVQVMPRKDGYRVVRYSRPLQGFSRTSSPFWQPATA